MGAHTILCSVVGDDAPGKFALSLLRDKGMSTDSIVIAAQGSRTAQYVAVNDARKDLVVAMADMKILETKHGEFKEVWGAMLTRYMPTWLVLDGNWDAETLHCWIRAARRMGVKIAFEPVSMEKSGRLLVDMAHRGPSETGAGKCVVDLAAPNEMELRAMTAGLGGQQNPSSWLGAASLASSETLEARIKTHTRLFSSSIDRGLIANAIQLLQYIPCILTKLGPRGVLQTEIIHQNDSRLNNDEARKHMMMLHDSTSTRPSGQAPRAIYIRHHPAGIVKPTGEIKSVNGVGDAFLGVLVASMARELAAYPEDGIEIAQRASLMTLMSSESVSPQIKSLARQAAD